MYLLIGLIAIPLVIAYLIFDMAILSNGFNDFLDKWLKKTLWIWLPFFALYALTKELMLKSQSKK